MPGITAACNVYMEANAIHGLLETASQFFDEIFILHTGPDGALSTDGTIETCRKWGARIEFGSINEGFGVIRTRLVTESKTDWVMILDADERFYPQVPLLDVEGTDRYSGGPIPESINLRSLNPKWINQGQMLRELMNGPWDVIETSRRHWFDHSWKRPTQNWHEIADWQSRTIRNNGNIGFSSDVKMHEQIRHLRGGHVNSWKGNAPDNGPYHDHFHCFYKPMEPEQRKQDIAIYDALHEGRPMPPTCHGAVVP